MEIKRVTIALSEDEMSALAVQAQDALRPPKFHAKYLVMVGLGLTEGNRRNDNSAASTLVGQSDAVVQVSSA